MAFKVREWRKPVVQWLSGFSGMRSKIFVSWLILVFLVSISLSPNFGLTIRLPGHDFRSIDP